MEHYNIFNKQIVFILFIFILLTFVFTYPLFLKDNSYIPAFHSTDEPYGALWFFWWTKYAHLNHLNAENINMIMAPFGWVFKPGYVLWNLLNKGLILITNPIFAYNIQIVSSFVLTGITMYLLSFYCLNSKLPALFSSIIFAFCPYHFMRSWQHLGLAHIQWMPLYIFGLLLLNEQKNIRNAVLVAIFFSLVMSFDIYYAYFMLIVTGIFFIFYSFNQKTIKEIFKFTKFLFIAGILAVLLESPDFYYIVKFMFNLNRANASRGVFGYIRPFEDLFSQSARPLSYILPASSHPIFGKFTEHFVGSPWYGESFTEHTLYLGCIPLILAFFAFRRWKKYKQILDSKENFYIKFFIFLAVIAWLFSQPPWWKFGPINIYMPTFFMYKILPMFRAYCRFGIVVMLAVAVLAGVGLKFILERLKSQKTKISIMALFCGLVFFEFWNYPPFKVIDVSKVPAVYYWLKGQPKDAIVAEYPLDINGANEMYKFYQTKHEKKIINGTIPGTYANRVARTIVRLSDQNTAGVLKWMGVKYVLVHKEDYLKTDLIEDREELDTIPNNPALKFIKHFPPQECPQEDIMCIQRTGSIDVYEVTTQPIKPKVEDK